MSTWNHLRFKLSERFYLANAPIEFETAEKPKDAGEFFDITAPMKETKKTPTLCYLNSTTVTLMVNDYTLAFDVGNLNRVLEMLGNLMPRNFTKEDIYKVVSRN